MGKFDESYRVKGTKLKISGLIYEIESEPELDGTRWVVWAVKSDKTAQGVERVAIRADSPIQLQLAIDSRKV
jgi:hypothetical protein